jgi:hypothetical protein
MDAPAADTLATVAAGRTAAVVQLGPLATRLEQLPLDAAAEVLVLLEPALAALEKLPRSPSSACRRARTERRRSRRAPVAALADDQAVARVLAARRRSGSRHPRMWRCGSAARRPRRECSLSASHLVASKTYYESEGRLFESAGRSRQAATCHAPRYHTGPAQAATRIRRKMSPPEGASRSLRSLARGRQAPSIRTVRDRLSTML